MDVTIPLFRISQPTENLFEAQVAILLKECKLLHGLTYKEQRGGNSAFAFFKVGGAPADL